MGVFGALILILVAVVGCGSDSLGSDADEMGKDEQEPTCPDGSEGCACYGNGTCDGTLECGADDTCGEEDGSPVPAVHKAGVRMHVFGTAACAVPQGVTAGIGEPPPDSMAAAGKGSPLFDGEKGVTASCLVSGGPSFTVAATAAKSPISFSVSGQIDATGNGSGSIGVYIPEANGQLSSPATLPCTLTAIVTSAGPQIQPGAVWAKFDCAQVTQPPGDVCRADGEFVFENCD
jgi:hypothetical protein